MKNIKSITQLVEQNEFDSIKRRIKVKLFDFDDEFDNTQIMDYVFKKSMSMVLAITMI